MEAHDLQSPPIDEALLRRLMETEHELERRVEGARLNESRLEAVLQLHHMAEASLKEITDFALEHAVALTKSKIGYLTFMNEDETVLTMHSWSKEAMADCAVSDKPIVYPVASTGLWGKAARQRKPVVTNDYPAPNPWKKGLPEGHVGLRRHMNVPILAAGRIVIVAGVGNKEDDYDESDVRQLTLLMEGMWALIQRHRMEAELRQHRDHLEHLVKERTEALHQSHEELQAIYDGMVDGLLVVDVETKRFLRVNPATCRMLGYTAEEFLRLSVLDIHPPDKLPEVLEKFQTHVETSGTCHEDIPLLRKDGSTFSVEVRSSHIVYNGRPSLVAFYRDITERKKAREALEREQRTLKHLLQSSDHERQLIAYDIHDGLAQQIAAAIMQFQMFDHLKENTPAEAAKAYEAGVAMLRQSHFEARRLISDVRPPILDESGIVAAIAHLVNDPGFEHGPKVELRSRVTFKRLAPVVENAIYRIVQEGVTNAWKHSKSDTVKVTLSQHRDHVRIEIRDWGVGFVVGEVREDRFGLEGIRERARLLGGAATITSTPGSGTRIIVKLPITDPTP